MALLVLSATEVDKIMATFEPGELVSLMSNVFSRLSSHATSIVAPQRISVTTDQHTCLFMPCRIANSDSLQGTTVKVVSVPISSSDTRGLPASTLVLDESTGAVKAIINARNLTALRTAAGSVLATKLMARPNPTHLVAFGAGKQIEAHVDLHLRTFPSFKNCVIVNRAINSRLQNLLAELQLKHADIEFSAVALDDLSSVEQAVRGASVICTATSSTSPLFPSAWVADDTHLNLVGSYKPSMHEIDNDLVRRANLVVDSREACMAEAGELIDAGVQNLTEIGELVADRKIGQGVTLFKSVGVGAQDTAIAVAVAEKARILGIGTLVGGFDDLN